MSFDDIFAAIDDAGATGTCPSISCPHCGKSLTVYLNIERVEVYE